MKQVILDSEKVPIERQEGVTLYGRVIDSKGRLGKFGVVSNVLGDNGAVFQLYSEAQKRMAALIGIQQKRNSS